MTRGQAQTSTNKVVNKILQKYVSSTFRRVCGVPGKDWPSPDAMRTNTITGEKYHPFLQRHRHRRKE
ncbi:hypothetical protein B0H10DRAFT_2078440 [Mycena sp. CBHHK59/15]|nr:hypothetical protein B0H10DRAFT_2078440 [Mycena sp. CBHHK59/15]